MYGKSAPSCDCDTDDALRHKSQSDRMQPAHSLRPGLTLGLQRACTSAQIQRQDGQELEKDIDRAAGRSHNCTRE